MTTLLFAVALQLQLPAPVGYVNDFARALQPAESSAMAATIEEVRQKSGGEIVVVTLPDLGGRPVIDVARDIGRQWRVGATGEAGDARRNAGVVLLLKPGRRPGDGQAEIAIASGSGAEGFVTDALAGRVRDIIGREAVAAGSYGAGLVAGVRALGEAYSREYGFELTGAVPQARRGPGRRPGGFPVGIIVAVVVLMVVLSIGGRRGGRGMRGGSGIANAVLWGVLSGMARGGRGGGGGRWGGGGFGGGFGGFGGGGGFSGGGASGRF